MISTGPGGRVLVGSGAMFILPTLSRDAARVYGRGRRACRARTHVTEATSP